MFHNITIDFIFENKLEITYILNNEKIKCFLIEN